MGDALIGRDDRADLGVLGLLLPRVGEEPVLVDGAAVDEDRAASFTLIAIAVTCVGPLVEERGRSTGIVCGVTMYLAVTMKMIRSTSAMSTKGVTLIPVIAPSSSWEALPAMAQASVLAAGASALAARLAVMTCATVSVDDTIPFTRRWK